MRAGLGWTRTATVSIGPFSKVAVIRARPRCDTPTTFPTPALGTLARKVSSDAQATGVSGMAGGAPPDVLAVTVSAAWNAVSPAGVIRDRVRRNDSEDVNMGTDSDRSTESVPGTMAMVVSRATVPSEVRRSRTRNRSRVTISAAEEANWGTREKRPSKTRGPEVLSKQESARKPARKTNGASTVARRSWRAIPWVEA